MTNITILRPGEHFMFKGFEWVCLDPNHPDGGLLAIMAEPWAKDVQFYPSNKFADERGNSNNYRTSNVRRILSDMANAVFEKKSLLPHTVDLVAGNGDRSYGTVNDKVFLITCNEYRKYRDYIPHYDSLIWTSTPLCCGDENYSDTGYASHVRSMSVSGKFYNSSACSNNAVVPACILNPEFLNLRKDMAYVEELTE